MNRMVQRRTGIVVVGLALTLGTATSACSNASKVISSAESAVSSASSAAQAQLDKFKNGVNGAADVTIGPLTVDANGRSAASVTVRNSTSSSAGYAVQVNFKNDSGSLLDTVVVTVGNVQPGATVVATATSTHTLTNPASVNAGTVLRH